MMRHVVCNRRPWICSILVVFSICVVSLHLLAGNHTPEKKIFDVLQVPVKDTYRHSKTTQYTPVTKRKEVVRKYSKSRNSSTDNNAVMQINEKLKVLLDEIIQSDTLKGKDVTLGVTPNYTCPQNLRYVNGVEDLLCMVRFYH